MEENESKELMVRKPQKGGYIFLAFVLVASIAGSVFFFSGGKIPSVFAEQQRGKQQAENVSGDKTVKTQKKSGEMQSANGIVSHEKENFVEENKPEEKIDTRINESEATNGSVGNRKLDATKPMVALTFDDGPDAVRTPQVLAILKQYNARATFFDIGDLMEENPETLKKEVASGCDVGGHTYSHVNLNELSPAEITEEIGKMEKVFKDITGQELKYIRPTYGNANATVRATVNRPLINWCVDSLDWKSRDTDKILEEIYKTEDFDGKIIIMHVIYDSTVEAIRKLVPELINRGYQLVTISEMAQYKGVTLKNGEIYYQF